MGGDKMESVKESDSPIPWHVRLLDPGIQFLWEWIYLKDGTVGRKIQAYFEPTVGASSKPVNGISSKDITIDAPTNVWVRLFTPTPVQDQPGSEKTLPVIIYYHGGGFAGLSPDFQLYDRFCRKIAKSCRAVVVSLKYRRAPEHPYPAAYDDCYKAFEWLKSPEARSNHLPPKTDVSQCFLMGDSAGGNIVHFMGCMAAENDISPVKVLGMVELQPFFGGEELIEEEVNMTSPLLTLEKCLWYWRAFLPPGETRDHPACNVFGPNSKDISQLALPPILVVIGSLDLLKYRQVRYVERLEEMGKDVTVEIYEGGYHGFYLLLLSDLIERMMVDVSAFILTRTRQ